MTHRQTCRQDTHTHKIIKYKLKKKKTTFFSNIKCNGAKVSAGPDIQMRLFSQKKPSLNSCARGVAWTNWDYPNYLGYVDATSPTFPWPVPLHSRQHFRKKSYWNLPLTPDPPTPLDSKLLDPRIQHLQRQHLIECSRLSLARLD